MEIIPFLLIKFNGTDAFTIYECRAYEFIQPDNVVAGAAATYEFVLSEKRGWGRRGYRETQNCRCRGQNAENSLPAL